MQEGWKILCPFTADILGASSPRSNSLFIYMTSKPRRWSERQLNWPRRRYPQLFMHCWNSALINSCPCAVGKLNPTEPGGVFYASLNMAAMQLAEEACTPKAAKTPTNISNLHFYTIYIATIWKISKLRLILNNSSNGKKKLFPHVLIALRHDWPLFLFMWVWCYLLQPIFP